MLYAVTDIETTGGHAAAYGITEIAVYIYDHQKVVEKFETLINPLQPIPRFIQVLTGITNEMVQLAPTFEEIAPRLFDLLQGKVFVAHNVNFDYSFLHASFSKLGYQLDCKKLCTVRYARKLFPKLPSYSLGNLCKQFDIPLNNRHRAGGDAAATVALLNWLQQNDRNRHLHTMLSKQSKEQRLPLHLDVDAIEQLPKLPGVYYFHDTKDRIVYVGKAKNLKKRVLGHFSGNSDSRQRQEFLRTIHRISYRTCGSEFMAMLLEAIEIRRIWPKYNKALKWNQASYALYVYTDQNGFKRLAIGRRRKLLPSVMPFHLKMDGLTAVKRLIESFALCPRLCFVDQTEASSCNQTHCKGVCGSEETPASYNQRIDAAIAFLKNESPHFLIKEPSFDPEQEVAVLMEHGRFFGMGLLRRDFDLESLEDIKEKLEPMPEHEVVHNLILRYAHEHPHRVVAL
jgi:DNA polymerase-3 subunit epsilon